MARLCLATLISFFLLLNISCAKKNECTECKREKIKQYIAPPGVLIQYPDSAMGEFCRQEIDSVESLDFYFDVDSSGTTIRYAWFYSCKPIE